MKRISAVLAVLAAAFAVIVAVRVGTPDGRGADEVTRTRVPSGAPTTESTTEPGAVASAERAPVNDEGRISAARAEETPKPREVTPERRRTYLRAGMHEALGITGDVTAELREIAREDLAKVWVLAESKRAAGILGVSGWSAMEEAAALVADKDPVVAQAMQSLMADALELATKVTERSDEAFRRGEGLEEWVEDESHDEEDWRRRNGFDGTKGALRFTSAVGLGGRQYRFHFDSERFPALEHDILILRGRMRELGMAGR
jgi:hypothetical protein